jgi:hypothetical protein
MTFWITISPLSLFPVVAAIYFPQKNYSLTITSDLEKDTELLKVFGLPEYDENGPVEYRLESISSPRSIQQRSYKNDQEDPIFGIQPNTGIVYLRRPISAISDLRGKK